jgi:trk system potassium uptake protein TrkA
MLSGWWDPMFVIVAGCGRLGAGLARVLSSQGDDVVVVSETIDMKWLGAEFDGVTMEGNPIDEAILESAGIRKAELFVAATSEDIVNAMAVQVAKEVFHVPHALARMTDPARERFYREMGLETVCPTSTGINQILDTIQRSGFDSLIGYIDPDIAGILPPPEWIGTRLDALPLPKGRCVAGFERKGKIVPAEGSIVLGPGDILVLRRAGESRRIS